MNALKKILIHLFLAIVLFLTIVPFLWMLSTSLKPSDSIFSMPPQFIPKVFTLEHYKELFTRVRFFLFFGNSVLIATCITLFNL
ncbi:MAG: carbohydrate ABC transporter permease, partial [Chlamydiota bacterium]|nr:carbohydrate ABC transporter permease [Chlamydiota bacterium]